MKTTLILALAVLGLGACTKTKAPGTKPTDMSAEDHHQACLDHKKAADADKARSEKLDGGKGTNTANAEAADHTDVAKQHEDAAKAVDPNAPDCP